MKKSQTFKIGAPRGRAPQEGRAAMKGNAAMIVEFTLNYETVKHLDAWLIREFNQDAFAEQLRQAMLRVIAEDEAYWANRSLWCAYDEAVKSLRLPYMSAAKVRS